MFGFPNTAYSSIQFLLVFIVGADTFEKRSCPEHRILPGLDDPLMPNKSNSSICSRQECEDRCLPRSLCWKRLQSRISHADHRMLWNCYDAKPLHMVRFLIIHNMTLFHSFLKAAETIAAGGFLCIVHIRLRVGFAEKLHHVEATFVDIEVDVSLFKVRCMGFPNPSR